MTRFGISSTEGESETTQFGAELNFQQALDNPEPPYRAIERVAGEPHVKMHEKRANQAGSKGIYVSHREV